MSQSYERYTIERGGAAVRITFDQRKNATVNFACGLGLAVLGYFLDVPAGTPIMWIGVVWALLAAKAYSHERVTELGDVVTYQAGKNVRSVMREDLTELVLRLRWRPRRNRKQSVLPWRVELWSGDRKPFVSYDFQDEGPARAFATSLGDELAMSLVEKIERGETVAA